MYLSPRQLIVLEAVNLQASLTLSLYRTFSPFLFPSPSPSLSLSHSFSDSLSLSLSLSPLFLQGTLQSELQMAYKQGDVTTQKRLERLLAPAEEGPAVKHPWA